MAAAVMAAEVMAEAAKAAEVRVEARAAEVRVEAMVMVTARAAAKVAVARAAARAAEVMVAAMGNGGGEDPPAMEAEEAMEAARTVDAMKVVEVVVVAMAAEAAAMWRARTSLQIIWFWFCCFVSYAAVNIKVMAVFRVVVAGRYLVCRFN